MDGSNTERPDLSTLEPDTSLHSATDPVWGVRVRSLGPPADTPLDGLLGTPHKPRRLHQGVESDTLRRDLSKLVAIADCPDIELGLRVTCAVEARHIIATLLARARRDGFSGTGSGLPEVGYDDGSPME